MEVAAWRWLGWRCPAHLRQVGERQGGLGPEQRASLPEAAHDSADDGRLEHNTEHRAERPEQPELLWLEGISLLREMTRQNQQGWSWHPSAP